MKTSFPFKLTIMVCMLFSVFACTYKAGKEVGSESDTPVPVSTPNEPDGSDNRPIPINEPNISERPETTPLNYCGQDSQVSSVLHPHHESINVPLDSIVSVTAIQAIDNNVMSQEPLRLMVGDEQVAATTVISGRTISVIPNAFLLPDTTYTISIDNELLTQLTITERQANFTTGDCSISADDLAMFREFKAKVLEWGPVMHDARKAREIDLSAVFSEHGNGTLYYDATYGYLAAMQWMNLTGDHADLWTEYANLSSDIYSSNAMNSRLPGRRVFPAGVYANVERGYRRDDSIEAIRRLRDEMEMNGVGEPSYVNNHYHHEGYARALSYFLETLLYYERAGAILDESDALLNIEKINLSKDALLGHLQVFSSHQYTDGRIGPYTYKFVQPFMAGLASDALIDYIDWLDERRAQLEVTTGLQTRDEAVTEILPALIHLANWLFDAENYVVTIDTMGLSEGDSVVFSSDIATFGDGEKSRVRQVMDLDIEAGVIKQVMPFAKHANPQMMVSGPSGDINHEIEEIVTMWIPDVGGTPGAWNDLGGAGKGGAFRYVVPSVQGVGSTKPATDLNMLMLTLFGFLYAETCDDQWKQRGDQVFSGGVQKAGWERGKQYNQQLKNTFDYLDRRQTNCD